MQPRTFERTLCSAAVAVALVLAGTAASRADFGGPPKKIDCSKPANKDKPACQRKHGEPLSDDEIYNAAYWMAKRGQYREALAVLAGAQNPDDPRILTATGFATRKLGQVDAALPYYHKALAIDPSLVTTREYLGEACLAKGDLAGAREQLAEIERRAGRASETYAKLRAEIAAYEAGVRQRS